MLKALFTLEIFEFLPWIFSHVEKRLDKITRLILQFMTSQTGNQIIVIHILHNISASKCNQAMNFVHLIDYNARNISPQKSFRK